MLVPLPEPGAPIRKLEWVRGACEQRRAYIISRGNTKFSSPYRFFKSSITFLKMRIGSVILFTLWGSSSMDSSSATNAQYLRCIGVHKRNGFRALIVFGSFLEESKPVFLCECQNSTMWSKAYLIETFYTTTEYKGSRNRVRKHVSENNDLLFLTRTREQFYQYITQKSMFGWFALGVFWSSVGPGE